MAPSTEFTPGEPADCEWAGCMAATSPDCHRATAVDHRSVTLARPRPGSVHPESQPVLEPPHRLLSAAAAAAAQLACRARS